MYISNWIIVFPPNASVLQKTNTKKQHNTQMQEQEEERFVVLYSTRLTQKDKRYQDGKLVIRNAGYRAILQDFEGQQIFSTCLSTKDHQSIIVGETIQLEGYLISVEEQETGISRGWPWHLNHPRLFHHPHHQGFQRD